MREENELGEFGGRVGKSLSFVIRVDKRWCLQHSIAHPHNMRRRWMDGWMDAAVTIHRAVTEGTRWEKGRMFSGSDVQYSTRRMKRCGRRDLPSFLPSSSYRTRNQSHAWQCLLDDTHNCICNSFICVLFSCKNTDHLLLRILRRLFVKGYFPYGRTDDLRNRSLFVSHFPQEEVPVKIVIFFRITVLYPFTGDSKDFFFSILSLSPV